MAGERSIEYQDLQQILDNFVKVGDENRNENVSATATVALSIWDNISSALDEWLHSISILEERQQKVNDLQKRISRKLEQIQQDGLISIYDFERLAYIGQVWTGLIDLVSSLTGSAIIDTNIKRLILKNLFYLYNIRQISHELFIEIILQL